MYLLRERERERERERNMSTLQIFENTVGNGDLVLPRNFYCSHSVYYPFGELLQIVPDKVRIPRGIYILL